MDFGLYLIVIQLKISNFTTLTKVAIFMKGSLFPLAK